MTFFFYNSFTKLKKKYLEEKIHFPDDVLPRRFKADLVTA